MNGQSVIDLIKKRTSVRTYSGKAIEQEKKDAMADFLSENTDNPFGAAVRFLLIDSAEAPKRLGTYGFIRGQKTYFAGCIKKGEKDLEGFGFAFEKAVLFAQSLGLETCWLGGTLKRGAFSAVMQPSDEEYMPAVTPLGYAKSRRSLLERSMAKSVGARKRKSFRAMFFDGSFDTPLTVDGDVKTCLEMVRIAPSASNKQPWRVVKTGNVYHFYMAKEKHYVGNTAFGFCMQRIDIGIAACHFMLSADELGMKTKVTIQDPQLTTQAQEEDGLTYIFTCEVSQ